MRGLLIALSLGIVAGLAHAEPVPKEKEKTTAARTIFDMSVFSCRGPVDLDRVICELSHERQDKSTADSWRIGSDSG